MQQTIVRIIEIITWFLTKKKYESSYCILSSLYRGHKSNAGNHINVYSKVHFKTDSCKNNNLIIVNITILLSLKLSLWVQS